VLICYDAATGKESWKRDLDECVLMPAEQAQEARPIRAEYYRRIRRLNQITFEWQSADAVQKETLLKKANELDNVKQEAFDRYSWGVGSAERAVSRQKEFGAKLKKVCGYDPITWSPTTLGVNMPTPVSDGKRVFVYTGRRTVHAFDLDGTMGADGVRRAALGQTTLGEAWRVASG
jgi:outer membrane protein assembly factor BamB